MWAVVYLPWLGLLDLLLEEPRRALIARTMLETGDFLVPRLGGEIYTAKPPLFNWLIAFSAWIGGGLSELTARLPSALAVLVLALAMVTTLGGRLSRPGLLYLGAALILAPEFIAKGTLAEIETLFTLLVAASVWSWFLLEQRGSAGWRLWLLPLCFVALAYLAKREPAVVFFYLSVVPYLLVKKRWRELFSVGHLLSAMLLVAIVGGWLSLVALQIGWGELWDTLQREVLQRGASQGWAAVATHVALYPVELFVALLPFSLPLPLLISGSVRRSVSGRYGSLFLFCSLAVICNLPVYWFRGDVSVRYFMPMFPLVLLLAAMIFETLWQEPDCLDTGSRRYLRVVFWGVAAVGALLGLLLLASVALPWFSETRQALLPAWLAVGIAMVSGAALWWCYRSYRIRCGETLLLLFVVTVLVGRALYFNLVLPDKWLRVQQERNAPAIVEKIRSATGGARVFAQGVPWAIWYYAPTDMMARLSEETVPMAEWLLLDAGASPPKMADSVPVVETARFSYKGQALVLFRRGLAESPGAP
ncbi:MAG: hypothetical protein Kow006_29000 [Gammaproteobacteria bacterium]